MVDVGQLAGQLGMGGGFSLDLKLIAYCLAGAIILAGLIFGIMKRNERKKYDTLVEITPSWSIQEHEQFYEEPGKEPNKFFKLLGFKAKPSQKIQVRQEFQTYFIPGAYLLNSQNGSYEIKFWDGILKRTVITPIDFKYFEPITGHKWAKRRLKLIRMSPLDFKPLEPKIVGYKEVRNVVDNEATFTQFKTMEEIDAKFKKTNAFTQFLPYIFAILAIGIFGLIVFMINKQYNETMNAGFSNLATAIQANTEAMKIFMSSAR